MAMLACNVWSLAVAQFLGGDRSPRMLGLTILILVAMVAISYPEGLVPTYVGELR